MIKILITTDFSENAQNAVNYAVNLFQKEICTFYILHAHLIAPPASEYKSEEVIHLTKIVQELKKKQNPCLHTFKWLLMTDIPISAIKATLTEKKIDYLFLGTKGNSTSSKISIGGTAISIIEFITNCPIVAVPAEASFNPLHEILFANDFTKSIHSNEVAPLLVLAKLWNTSLNILYIKTKKGLSDVMVINKKTLIHSLSGVQQTLAVITPKGSIAASILGWAEENRNVGMVALLKNKNCFFEGLLRSPVIRNVTLASKLPLLFLPLKNPGH